MKSIRTEQDLAIFGAPPAFPEPLHVGRPNIGDRNRLLARINGLLDRRWLSNGGPLVREFEQTVAARLGVKHCVAMCNGTIALEIAIRALGLEGEVIVPSWTFIATAHALSWQGITPVFADIDPLTHNLDPVAVERMITPRTTGIIGVHLWGRPAPVDALQTLADQHGLVLMFDASHAFGCSCEGVPVGHFGRCEVFSFHATKFFNTFEGGAVVTNDDDLAATMRLMKNFGFQGYDNVVHPGTNGKMTEICAAMGLTGLESLDAFTDMNRCHHAVYREALDDIPGLSVLPFDDGEQNNYQYVVAEVDEGFGMPRDALVSVLHAENVLARKYFWPGCHRMKPYRDLYPHAGLLLPNTIAVGERNVVLPTGTGVTADDIQSIADILRLVGRQAEAITARIANT